MKRLTWIVAFILGTLIFSFPLLSRADDNRSIPILCYHNFNPTVPGSMNLTPQKLESQIKWLKDNGYNIIPLKDAVAYLEGKSTSLPSKAIVITVDDGWKSAYTYLFPIVKKYNIPVTLFIYPQTISEGKNAMTWDELKTMKQTGLFDIQGHTYSHPNFKQAKKHLSPAAYEKLVNVELVNSKKILEDKLGVKITILAWPFGIYDPYLEKKASDAGYEMALSIDGRPATRRAQPMSMPRFMIIDALSAKRFDAIANMANKNK